jgi:hypothetical protein
MEVGGRYRMPKDVFQASQFKDFLKKALLPQTVCVIKI